jgi:succinate dehydrogenase/fumarate reductase flavoprotein subunit
VSDAREVIVVGGGMAGLTAALAAAEAGGDVLVLESEPAVGGSMAISGGLIWSPATFELARRWIPRGNPELQRILVDELEDAWSWFEHHGLPLDPPVACLKDRMGRGRLMSVGGPGARRPWAEILLGAAERHGAEVITGARVESVEPSAEGWTVTWTHGDSPSSALARAVVFCGGGFQNSKELVRRYVSPWPEDMVIRSNRSSDGAALRSLLPLGAPVSHGMHSFYGHTLPFIDGKAWDDGLEFLAGSLYFSDFCLIVNQLGLRFTDESVGCIDEHNAERGCQQPHGRYYVVFDERIRRERIDVDLMGIPGIEATRVPEKLVQLRELGASIVTAETPDELAAAMDAEFGVPAANMSDTLRTFNAAVDPIHELDPPRRRDHSPIMEAPLRAIACVSGITYTMGGLKVTPDMRVPGSQFDGIFAAGADAGNVFEDVYGGGLGWAAVSGRRAGRSAVAHAPGTTTARPSTRPASSSANASPASSSPKVWTVE